MKKYLGSKLTIFAAIVAPVFVCVPLLLGVYAMCAEVSVATVFLMVGGVACAFIWGIYIKSIGNQLYSWGYFTSEGVRIKTCFSKKTIMVYEKCSGCGIGLYTHGILNSKVGTRMYFIYLSYDKFDERFREDINLWKTSQTRIKVQFDSKLYDYLLTVLPKKQLRMLMRDYEKYFG
jgi:hypothetical protein